MNIFLSIGKTILNFIYGVHKLFPEKNKVAIISRQSDIPSYDINRLEEGLLNLNDAPEVKVLCKTLGGSIFGKILYIFHIIGPQMHALATSRVIVLDSYCIAVSNLKHKDDLNVIQMWHAMGSFKMFGKSILDREEGSSSKLAKALNMHKGYTAFLTSSKRSLPCFADAFGYESEKGIVAPLPRYDYLTNTEEKEYTKKKLIDKYQLDDSKKTILYAPTFRKTANDSKGARELIENIDPEKYNFIYSPHPLSDLDRDIQKYTLPGASSLELMSISDVVVSDYSALIFESALAGIPTYLFAYDYDDYFENRSFYIDMERDIPMPILKDAREVYKSIENEECSKDMLSSFAGEFVEKTEDACGHIVKIIRDML